MKTIGKIKLYLSISCCDWDVNNAMEVSSLKPEASATQTSELDSRSNG